MRILFLYNSFLPEPHWNCLKAQEKNMGAIPPLNLCYVAAIVRAAGHDVALLDLQVDKVSFEELIYRIKKYNPDFLGFTITTYLFHPVLDWIRKIKLAVNIPAVVGGFHLSLYPWETMEHKEIDYAFIGFANRELIRFLDCYGDEKKYSTIKGLCYRLNGRVFINASDNAFEINNLPLPARDLLKNECYGNFISERKNFTVMLTGTGCPFQCKYCATTFSKCFMRSPSNVVDEIEICYENYGVREIDFYDQSFTIDKKRTIEICKEIIRRKIDIIWTIRTRADLIDEELLSVMKKAGLYRIMYGIESGDQNILDKLNKNESVEDIAKVVLLTKQYGIKVLGFFMLGCPGETEETMRKTQRLALCLPFDDIQVTRFTLFPGTAFYDEYLVKECAVDYWRNYIKDRNLQKTIKFLDSNLDVKIIDKKIKSTYLRFYLRFKIIYKRIFCRDIVRSIKKHTIALIDVLFS